MPEAAPSPGVAQWHAQRGQLTALAYRMLGQWAQAEDVVSAVGEQIPSMDPAMATGVRRWEGYLRALTTRRAIDALRSVQQQRTEYVGTWLPEPVDQALLPEDAVANESMLRLGVLFLLEELSAPARAAYVLHHGLGYSSSQIANVLEMKPAAVRQMFSRAARKLAEPKPRNVRKSRSKVCWPASCRPLNAQMSSSWSPCSMRRSSCTPMAAGRCAPP